MHIIGPHCAGKTEKPAGMNIKLRLAEEGELEDGAARGPTLEFVLEKDGMILKEVEQEAQHKQFCTEATEDDRTEPYSADSSQNTNSNSAPDAEP